MWGAARGWFILLKQFFAHSRVCCAFLAHTFAIGNISHGYAQDFKVALILKQPIKTLTLWGQKVRCEYKQRKDSPNKV